jgi:6-phospho-beta-glucosidase
MLAEEIAAAAERGTRAEQVMKVEKELFELYADPHLDSKPEQLSFRGGSYYSEVALELIRAIHNNLGTQLVVNTANRGAIRGLPDDAVIETNCIVDAQGAHPLTFGTLPDSMHALTQQVKAYERLTIEAAVHGDRRSGLLALVTNPLVGNANVAQPLLDDVLAVNAPYLPQFK